MALCRAVFAFLVVFAAVNWIPGVAHAEEVVVIQAAAASDPGAKKVSIPATLKAYEAQLKENPFGTFTDAGKDTVRGNGGTVALGGYSVEVSVMGKSEKGKVKVQITIKENGKAIGSPLKTELTSHPMMMKAGDPNAPKIFLFTVKDE